MVILDEHRVQWIKDSLRATHDMLSMEEAQYWEDLFQRDCVQFFSSATFGFMKKRFLERGQLKFPDHELKEFCAEFRFKIGLALSGAHGTISLPLFDICGIDLMKQCQGRKEANEYIAPGGSA